MAAGIARGEGWWRNGFEKYEQSGISIEAFCKQEQVAISSFYTWKKRLSLKDKSGSKPKPVTAPGKSLASRKKEALFIPIHIDSQLRHSNFTPITKDSTSKLEIILANGNIVRLQANQSEVLDILNLVVSQ
jgi:hypothetical protein